MSSLCKPYLSIIKKKKKPDYPSQIIRVILMQGPCSSIEKKKLRHPCAGAMRQCPAEDKASGLWRGRGHLFSLSRSAPARNSYLRTSSRGFHRFAPRDHDCISMIVPRCTTFTELCDLLLSNHQNFLHEVRLCQNVFCTVPLYFWSSGSLAISVFREVSINTVFTQIHTSRRLRL